MAHGNGKADSVSPMLFETTKEPRQTVLEHLDRLSTMGTEFLREIDRVRSMVMQSPTIEISETEKKAAPSRILLHHFQKKHEQRFQKPVAIEWAKDSALMNRLLRVPYSEAQVLELIDKFFERDDDFTVSRGFTVGMFYSAVPGMIATAARPAKVTGVTARTTPNKQHSTVAASMIRQQFQNRS